MKTNNHKKPQRGLNRKAFTVIELVLVLTILGIIVTFSMPNFLDQSRSVQGMEITNDVKFVTYNTSKYEVENNSSIVDIESLPEIDPEEIRDAYKENRIYGKDGYAHVSYLEGFYDLTGTEVVEGITTSVDGKFAQKKDDVYFISAQKVKTTIKLTADTTPPVITIDTFPTDPTNQDVVICASTNEGYLNENCHTFTENGEFVFVATDLSGNKTEETIMIGFIDKDAPEITYAPNGDTNPKKAHVATITVSDQANSVDEASLEYVWSTSATAPGSGWIGFSSGDMVSKNDGTGQYYLYVGAADNLGNSHIVRSEAFNVDNTPPTKPTITADTSTGIGYIDISYSPDSAQKEFKINSGAWESYVGQITLNNNATVYARGIDIAGNISAEESQHIIVDMEPPIITFATNGSSAYKKSQETIVSVTDEKSSVDDASLEYVWSTSATAPATGWAPFTNGQTLSKAGVTGTHYLHVKAADTIGNATIASSNAFEVDNTIPSITIGTNGNSTYKKSHSTTVSAADAGGIATLQYVWSTSTTTPSSGWTNFTSGSTVSKDSVTGAYYLHIKAVDSAGNIKNARTNAFNFDNTLPTVSFGTNGSTTPQKSHNTTVSVSDNISVSSSQYAWSTSTATPSSGWTSFTNGDTIAQSAGTGNYYLHIKATDSAGNVANIRSNAFNMDNTAPALPTVTHTTTATTTGTVTMTASFPADAVIKQYKLSTTSTWSNYTGSRVVQNNATFHFRSADAAGNYSGTKSHTISNITPRYYYDKYTSKSTTNYRWYKYTTINKTVYYWYGFGGTHCGGSSTNRWRNGITWYLNPDTGEMSTTSRSGWKSSATDAYGTDWKQVSGKDRLMRKDDRFDSYQCDNTVASRRRTDTESSKGSYIGTASSTTSSAYPTDGKSGSYWYTKTTSTISYSRGTLVSSNLIGTSYPTNGRHTDGYWYVKGSLLAP